MQCVCLPSHGPCCVWCVCWVWCVWCVCRASHRRRAGILPTRVVVPELRRWRLCYREDVATVSPVGLAVGLDDVGSRLLAHLSQSAKFVIALFCLHADDLPLLWRLQWVAGLVVVALHCQSFVEELVVDVPAMPHSRLQQCGAHWNANTRLLDIAQQETPVSCRGGRFSG